MKPQGLAHYVLPATSPLERADLPFFFPLFLGMQSKPYLSATEEVIAPDGNQRDEATIYMDLASASGVGLFGSKIAQIILRLSASVYGFLHPSQERSLPIKGLLSLLLKINKQPSFKTLTNTPNGIERPKAKTGNFLKETITTDNGKLNLTTDMLIEEADGLDRAFEDLQAPKNAFKLITKRAHHTHNSWTQNIEEMTRSKDRQTNHLYMHPDDATALDLSDDDIVDIQSEKSTIRLPLKTLSDLKPGIVAVPHGWGHQHAKGLSVASKIGGANVNLLANDGPDGVEKISGMVHLTGISVSVKKKRRRCLGEFLVRDLTGLTGWRDMCLTRLGALVSKAFPHHLQEGVKPIIFDDTGKFGTLHNHNRNPVC